MAEIPEGCSRCALFFRTNFFCSVLRPNLLSELSERSSHRVLKAKEYVSWDMLEARPVFGIAEGILGVRRIQQDGRGTIAAFFVPGDIVDLRGAPERLQSDLTALTRTEVCHLSPAVFDKILSNCDEAREIAWKSLQSQSFRLIEQTAELPKKRAAEKLAWFICEFRRFHGIDGVNGAQGPLFRVPFKNVDLADYLGIQPETISRSFRCLESKGAIRLLRSNLVEILDQKLLLAIASRDPAGVAPLREARSFRILRVS